MGGRIGGWVGELYGDEGGWTSVVVPSQRKIEEMERNETALRRQAHGACLCPIVKVNSMAIETKSRPGYVHILSGVILSRQFCGVYHLKVN